MKAMPHRRRATAFLVCLAAAGACAEERIVFPVQDAAGLQMQSVLEGTLTLEGSCLYASAPGQDRILPVWPAGFSYEADGEDVIVMDADGDAVAQTGAPFSASGGEEKRLLDADLEERVAGCDGPYWIVGEVR
jgi:hypothetical protein